ncbi:MAG: SURF1 family protein [Pseudomonadota bacterium]
MTEGDDPRRPLWIDVLILLLAGAVFVALIGLGNWQVRRLAWKTDLIETVDARAFGEAVAAPTGPVSAETHAYLRVSVDGIFRHDLARRVKAVTELGPGHWLMTPLETGDDTLWINRGFVPMGLASSGWTEPQGPQKITGLLRVTEPGGTLLERNDPAAERWVSRDVDALSEVVGIADVRGYFVDADHGGAADEWPRGGLTNVTFRNTHLSYALTWYAMALLFLGAMIYVIWDRRRARASLPPEPHLRLVVENEFPEQGPDRKAQ